MNMPDKTSVGINSTGVERLPAGAMRKRAVGIFVLLQLYFAGNILSFGFWKSGRSIFEYMTVFYAAWLAGLILLLLVCLGISARARLARFDPVVFIIFSLPFCFGLWLKTLGVSPEMFVLERRLDRPAVVHILPVRRPVYGPCFGGHRRSRGAVIHGALGDVCCIRASRGTGPARYRGDIAGQEKRVST